jgi:hypothetical protein
MFRLQQALRNYSCAVGNRTAYAQKYLPGDILSRKLATETPGELSPDPVGTDLAIANAGWMK